jgi:DNA-binding NarL/FixJ family response regulator
MPSSNLTAIVVEDDRFFQIVVRESFGQIAPGCELHIFGTAREALLYCQQPEASVNLALVDLSLPDHDGLTVIREVVKRFPRAHVIVLSVSSDEGKVLSAVRAGATGYLLKGDTNLSVTRGIEQALKGMHPISPALAGYFLRLVVRETLESQSPLPALTPRELDLLKEFSAGKSYNDAAKSMGISLTTVQTHTRNLYRKLGVRSGLHAISKAKAHGIL